MARDSYSYMHLMMIAGIVLVALGLKKTIGHFDDHLDDGPRLRPARRRSRSTCSATSPSATATSSTINRQRLLLAIVLLILVPVATEIPAIAAVAIANVLLWAMIVYETRLYGEGRYKVRHPDAAPSSAELAGRPGSDAETPAHGRAGGAGGGDRRRACRGSAPGS